MTVRETLDFAGRCLGVGVRYQMLAELLRREKESGIIPDPDIDAFMKATSLAGQKSSLETDYILKVLLSLLRSNIICHFIHCNFLWFTHLWNPATDSWIRYLRRHYGW